MHTLAAANISAEDVTRLLIALAVLLGLARVLGEVARKLKQPAVLGEILKDQFKDLAIDQRITGKDSQCILRRASGSPVDCKA